MTSRSRSAVLAAVLLALLARGAAAAGAITSSFFGAFGTVASSAGTATLTTSGWQTGAFAMSSAARSSVEGGFLRLFAVQTSAVPGGPSYSVTYALAAADVTLTLPADACPANSVVTLQAPATVPPDGARVRVVPGTVVQVSGCADSSIPVRLTYANLDATGLPARLLKIAVHNDASGEWVPLDTRTDGAATTLTAAINHLTTFAVVQSDPSGGVGSVSVYPNPFRASRGDLGVTFASLPAGATLRIYTVRGEEVQTLTADQSGQAFWDAANRSGAAVATGVYFVVLRGPGASKTIEVGVQR